MINKVYDYIYSLISPRCKHRQWDKVSRRDWLYLLENKPQFAEHCDWGKLMGFDWSRLLENQPQFSKYCDKWDEFEGIQIAFLLIEQPQLGGYFSTQFKRLDKYDWEVLLAHQPEFKEQYISYEVLNNLKI